MKSYGYNTVPGSRSIIYKGEKKPIRDWAIELGIPDLILRNRICMGWSPERALETPFQEKERKEL
jgi:hypothetical protein